MQIYEEKFESPNKYFLFLKKSYFWADIAKLELGARAEMLPTTKLTIHTASAMSATPSQLASAATDKNDVLGLPTK